MSFFQAILLGTLQGVTEFLPVSSSGHLVVMKSIFNIIEIPVLFDVLLHISTLFVVIIVFRTRILSIIRSLFSYLYPGGVTSGENRENLRLFLIIILASVFTATIGLGVSFLNVERNPMLVSILFLVTGSFLLFSKFSKGKKEYGEIGVVEGIVTGTAQGLGVFPGISRSGITISAALFSGMDRQKAGEFSFLLFIPAVSGALVLKLKEARDLFTMVSPWTALAGVSASFIVGLFSLKLLLKLVRGGKLYYFTPYLFAIGIAGLIWL